MGNATPDGKDFRAIEPESRVGCRRDALRILVVYPYFPHYRRDVLLRLEREPGVVVAFASDLVAKDGVATMDVGEFDRHVRTKTRWFGDILWQSGVMRELDLRKFHAVIFSGDAAHVSTWIYSVMARLRGLKVLFWTIGWHKPDRGLRKLVRLSFYRLANCLLLYGRVAYTIGTSMGYPPQKMVVIGNSMGDGSTNVGGPGVVASGLMSSGVVLGAVLRLIPQKRLDLLFRAAALMRERGRDASVLIAGDGPERARLEGLAEQLGVPATFLGEVYDERVLTAVYGALAATVVPGAIGLTAIQSLRHGVPVVTNDDAYSQGPEWEAVIPGRTGEHFRNGSLESLVQAIERLMVRRNSEEGLADICRAEVERNWSSAASARKIRDAVAGLCASDSGCRG